MIDKRELLGDDYRLFQTTPAWELAKAVWDQDVSEIKAILSVESSLVDYQEPVYGNTLLLLTVKNQHFKSFIVLLDNGADVDLHNTYDGTSALIEACRYSTYDIKFVEALLKNGANVNDIEVGERREGNSTRDTPLIAACKQGRLELVDLLIKYGADINYKNEFNQSALSEATRLERYYVVLFLLNNGVDYTLPISFNEEQNKTYHLVDELRFYMPELGTKEHKQKMQIVSFLRARGIEYRDIPVPDYVVRKAKEDYPATWEEYLKKY